MLNSDFGFLPLNKQPGTTTGPAANGSTSGLYRELHAEVTSFIENGSGTGFAAPAPHAAPAADAGTPDADQQAFLDRIAPLAREAGARLGVSPDLISAQAALETGWGKSTAGGNLFGIKATGGWRGDVAQATTTEYEQGEAVQRSEAFRAYPDAASSFRDFTALMMSNPRYQGVLHSGDNAAAYAQGLQRGGYATDPAYADKLARVAARIQGGK
ncbi:glucosaminidase domain-containing protein [Paucibacter sp. R3-3]|uniref:Glucosaminidase domain-containing protein n=1 Tax=Roseateles agri TaxID=3098619 RepID=A0ABU5DM92_9BURK|nr:glucosaminidase domain-containing protein [Paucibacter sp. R3-3]MDY0747425.1 glucosaminidase domain-containing protein [Paucibacter sp. R3-3]